MNVAEVEELAALAENCSEAESLGDRAAREALENELHARMSIADIRNLEAPDPRTGERSASETNRLRGALERIWSNAAARLD